MRVCGERELRAAEIAQGELGMVLKKSEDDTTGRDERAGDGTQEMRPEIKEGQDREGLCRPFQYLWLLL